MQSGTFRKNVMRSMDAKAAKLGLKNVAKNTQRTSMVMTAVLFASHVGQLIQALSQYILGLQLSSEMKDTARTAMQDIGFDLAAFCRVLRISMPASTKKSKLSGTRTAAVLQLWSAATAILTTVSTGVFSGPKMKIVTKMVTIPSKAGAKEERQVSVVDPDLEKGAESERQESIKAAVGVAIDVYWRICYDLFETPPWTLFDEKMERMKVEFPHVEFETADEVEEPEPVGTQA